MTLKELFPITVSDRIQEKKTSNQDFQIDLKAIFETAAHRVKISIIAILIDSVRSSFCYTGGKKKVIESVKLG